MSLTLKQRLEQGEKDWQNFKAEQQSQPEYKARSAEARDELLLWEQIARIRQTAGLSQVGLAAALGTSQGAIAHLEKPGREGYTVSTLRKLALATNHRLVIRFEPADAE